MSAITAPRRANVSASRRERRDRDPRPSRRAALTASPRRRRIGSSPIIAKAYGTAGLFGVAVQSRKGPLRAGALCHAEDRARRPSRSLSTAKSRSRSAISISRADWGWAPEFVEAMWLMLQQPQPQDIVIADRPLRDVARIPPRGAFAHLGLDWAETRDDGRKDCCARSSSISAAQFESRERSCSVGKRTVQWGRSRRPARPRLSSTRAKNLNLPCRFLAPGSGTIAGKQR